MTTITEEPDMPRRESPEDPEPVEPEPAPEPEPVVEHDPGNPLFRPDREPAADDPDNPLNRPEPEPE